jgi:hypothetical protein
MHGAKGCSINLQPLALGGVHRQVQLATPHIRGTSSGG